MTKITLFSQNIKRLDKQIFRIIVNEKNSDKLGKLNQQYKSFELALQIDNDNQ